MSPQLFLDRRSGEDTRGRAPGKRVRSDPESTRGLIAALPVVVACGPGDPPAGRGAFPHRRNGIAFAAQDRLYMASALGDEIGGDLATGEPLKRLGVPTPDDLAFGPDGSLYWTSLETGEVGRLSPQGERSQQFVGRGVNPITFSGDGRLFVALTHHGDILYQLDPDLLEAPRLVARDLGGLNGIDWGPDDRLHAPVWSRGERELLARLAPHLDNLAFDSRDRLFVSHSADGAVYELLPDRRTQPVGAPPAALISPGPPTPGIRGPGPQPYRQDPHVTCARGASPCAT